MPINNLMDWRSKPNVLSQSQILNVELQEAQSRGDTQNAGYLRNEMKAGKVQESGPATFKVKAPDGSIITVNAPPGATEEQAIEFAASTWKPKDAPQLKAASGGMKTMKDVGVGVLRGAKDVLDTGADWLSNLGGAEENARVKAMNTQGKAEFDAQYSNNTGAHIGRVGGNVLATLPVGGVLAKAPQAMSKLPMLANQAPMLNAAATALRTGGFRTGLPAATTTAGKVGNMALRSGAGAAVGGVSAGLVNEDSAGLGAAIGGALPPVLAGTGKVLHKAGSAIRGAGVSPEVQALAARAKELGINIPADRIANSRPMNALASSLNYVPFSGRAATESNMTNQLTRAASRLIGQDSDNMAMALRKARDDLGGRFDSTLKSATVKLDDNLLDDIVKIDDIAQQQLGSSDYKAIASQVAELLKKGEAGAIDGQAAYNIKKTLDRMGRDKSPSAYHALELKRALMAGLDRSLGPKEAAAFAKTREQYGNMMALEKIALNGAEGDISVARLAGMKNINNKPLQEVADIAAQFVKPREGQHGAMQRTLAAAGVGGMAGPAWLAGGAAAGRAGNMLLNSNAARSLVLKKPGDGLNRLANRSAPALYRTAPVLAADR